jgi:NAD kinase
MNNESKIQYRRKMNLRWCDRDNCGADDILRERVVGEHNEIMFDHPATGQVAYSWQRDNLTEEKNIIVPRVLLLVKKNDDDLLKVASEVVKELTSIGDLKVMLNPDVAAKFKYYYEVDNEEILLFDPKPVKGFGASHLALDDIHYNAFPLPNDSDDVVHCDADGPDLICTLGGDGLLMYASHLFPASCPPILCVAGGSLGFLTPFSTDEMIDAIRISLGLRHEDDHEFYNDLGGEAEDYWSGIHIPIKTAISDEYNQNAEFKENQKDMTGSGNLKPKVKFGANYQICLSMRMRLDCRVINREGVVRARFNVLNEVVIDRGSSPYLAALECFCDNVHLTTVQADGIIFST